MSADTIIISVCGKYKDFCANQSRTLIIDPIDEQKQAYEFLNKVFDNLVSQLKIGLELSEVHKNLMEYTKTIENAEFAKFLPKTLGYGIGLKPKEELLAIKDDNSKVIEAGMVFNVRLSLANFSVKKIAERNCLQIADTILIVSDGPAEVLTRSISKAYNDISYTLNDSEDDLAEGAEGEKSNVRREPKPRSQPKNI